ncbi:MAG TPA: hypothetical protein V6D23_12465 [Candidatus Obscuribacterales bacterium]
MNLATAPVIQSIEICRDEANMPMHLLLRGSNLPAALPFSVIVDGSYSPGAEPGGTLDAAETLVRIPDPRTFAHNRVHSVILTAPNGVAIKRF